MVLHHVLALPQVIAESVMGDIESAQSEDEDREGWATSLAQTLRFLHGWEVNRKQQQNCGWSIAAPPCWKKNFAEEEGRNVGLEMTEKAGLHSRVSVGLLSVCHVFPAHQSSLTTRTFDVKYLKVCELPGADFCEEDGAWWSYMIPYSPITLPSHIKLYLPFCSPIHDLPCSCLNSEKQQLRRCKKP